MCIAILKTKKGVITDNELRNSFNNNSDGAGIAYTKNNELRIVKGIFNVETFIKTVRQAEELADNNILIHCRIGTSGKKDKNNTHPFLINNNICLIHNGILDVHVPKGSEINDTQIFINKFMRGIKNETILRNKTYQNAIEELIGYNNKFVIMNNKGEFIIMNEEAGNWEKGVWYSNNSHLRSRTTYVPSTSYTNYTNYKQNSLFDDEDEYFEDDMIYNDTDLITDEEYYDIISQIQNLTYDEIASCGSDICYDTKTKRLMCIEEAEYFWDKQEEPIYFLNDLSFDLFNLYMDYAEEIIDYVKELEANEVA